MLTYEEAVKLMGAARYPERGKPLENNTRLWWADDWFGYGNDDWNDAIVVVLHNTAIVTIYPDGTYVLVTGGWYSNTTRARMSDYAPGYIKQKNYEWYWSAGYDPRTETHAPLKLFYDGMRVSTFRVIAPSL